MYTKGLRSVWRMCFDSSELESSPSSPLHPLVLARPPPSPGSAARPLPQSALSSGAASPSSIGRPTRRREPNFIYDRVNTHISIWGSFSAIGTPNFRSGQKLMATVLVVHIRCSTICLHIRITRLCIFA
ncbi:hypothetical protein ACS0TY_033471 [Phlomoides rotata]